MADETGPVNHAEPRWKAGWEDQETNSLEASLAATPLQRLEWLEEALELAAAAGSAPRGDRSHPKEAEIRRARPPGSR